MDDMSNLLKLRASFDNEMVYSTGDENMLRMPGNDDRGHPVQVFLIARASLTSSLETREAAGGRDVRSHAGLFLLYRAAVPSCPGWAGARTRLLGQGGSEPQGDFRRRHRADSPFRF